MTALGNLGPSYLAGDEHSRASLRDARGHVVLVNHGDARGPRVLGIPRNYQRLMLRGVVVDDCPAVSQFGEEFYYDGDRDLWVPSDAHDEAYDGPWMGDSEAEMIGPLNDSAAEMIGPLGRRSRAQRRALRKSRRRTRRVRRRRRVKRVFKRIRTGAAKVLSAIRKSKIFRAIQKGISKILSNKAIQKIAGRALSVFGIPARVTRGILAREADLMKKGGRVRIAELLAKGKYKEASRLIKGGFKAGIKSAMAFGDSEREMIGPLGACAMAGEYDERTGTETMMLQGGIETPAAHVATFVGLGDIDPEQLVVSPIPAPGQWYRIKKGDSLFKITSLAYGVKAGKERLAKARWINRAAANRVYATKDTQKGMFPEGLLSFFPEWSESPPQTIVGTPGKAYALIYIPMTPGDEPPEKPEPEAAPEPMMPELPPPPPPEPEPVVMQPLPPPIVVPPPEPMAPEPEPEPLPPPPPEPMPPAAPQPPIEHACPPPLVWSEGGRACVYPSPSQGPTFAPREAAPAPQPAPQPEPMPELPEPEPMPSPEPTPEPMPELPEVAACPPDMVRTADGACVYRSPSQGPTFPTRGGGNDWLPTALMLFLLGH